MDFLDDRFWISYTDKIISIGKNFGNNVDDKNGFTNADEYVSNLIYESISRRKDEKIITSHTSNELYDEEKLIEIFDEIFDFDTSNYRYDFEKEAFKDYILGKFSDEYVQKHYSVEDYIIKYNDLEHRIVEDPKIGGIENYSTPAKNDTRNELINSINKHLPNQNITYLGLEGPSFKSYLALKKNCGDHELKLNSIIPEKDERSYNLMNSLKQNNSLIGRTTELIKRDLDDLIISRFLITDRVIVNRGNNFDNEKEWNTKNYIQFKRDYENNSSHVKIEVDTYDKIIEYIALGKNDSEIISELELNKFRSTKGDSKWSTKIDESEGEDIIDYIRNKTIHRVKNNTTNEFRDIDIKFNVVNLDYNGQATEKRKYAIKTLFDNFLKDKSIICVNFNAHGKHSGGLFGEHKDKIINSLEEIVGDEFKITNLFDKEDLSYRSHSVSKTAMEGMIYFVEKL